MVNNNFKKNQKKRKRNEKKGGGKRVKSKGERVVDHLVSCLSCTSHSNGSFEQSFQYNEVE